VPQTSTASSTPYLIGIAGPSCAGKSELAKHLAARLGAAILPLDCYYIDLGDRPLEERPRFNFDEPKALDHDLLIPQLIALANGKAIDRPVYDFSTHSRSQHLERVVPGSFIIVEGLFALYWPEIRDLLGTKIYVDFPDDQCLERRIDRDTHERGRTPDSVRRQFAETVRPMAELHVHPAKKFADLIIAGDNPIQNSVALALAHLLPRAGSRRF
jgi:uridine kinase